MALDALGIDFLFLDDVVININQIKDMFSINENNHKTQIRLIDGGNWKTCYTTSQIQDILRKQYNKKHKL
jgi:hypothetical protein